MFSKVATASCSGKGAVGGGSIRRRSLPGQAKGTSHPVAAHAAHSVCGAARYAAVIDNAVMITRRPGQVNRQSVTIDSAVTVAASCAGVTTAAFLLRCSAATMWVHGSAVRLILLCTPTTVRPQVLVASRAHVAITIGCRLEAGHRGQQWSLKR